MRFVFYSTEHCPNCKVMLPNVQELIPEVSVVKLDSDSPEIETLGIMTVPVLIAFSDGIEVARLTGGTSRSKIKEFLIDKI